MGFRLTGFRVQVTPRTFVASRSSGSTRRAPFFAQKIEENNLIILRYLPPCAPPCWSAPSQPVPRVCTAPWSHRSRTTRPRWSCPRRRPSRSRRSGGRRTPSCSVAFGGWRRALTKVVGGSSDFSSRGLRLSEGGSGICGKRAGGEQITSASPPYTATTTR